MINENQIRCTLTKEDLNSRHLKISELAYGSEKAKLLFREMMQKAATDYGFEANDIPLMIEAIPISPESIILIITKVTDPEELDTRFSKFTPYQEEEEVDDTLMSDMEHIRLPETPEDVINFFKKLYERIEKNTKSEEQLEMEFFDARGNFAIATFPDFDSLTKLAKDLSGRYKGSNSLYKAPGSDEYTLVMEKDPHSDLEFSKFCFLIPEYGQTMPSINGSVAHILEHYRCIIKNEALQVLSNL